MVFLVKFVPSQFGQAKATPFDTGGVLGGWDTLGNFSCYEPPISQYGRCVIPCVSKRMPKVRSKCKCKDDDKSKCEIRRVNWISDHSASGYEIKDYFSFYLNYYFGTRSRFFCGWLRRERIRNYQPLRNTGEEPP